MVADAIISFAEYKAGAALYLVVITELTRTDLDCRPAIKIFWINESFTDAENCFIYFIGNIVNVVFFP